MSKVPFGANEDERRVFNAIWDEITQLKTGNVDLHKRRFLNGHKAVSRGDFITKGQFDDTISTVVDALNQVDKKITRKLVSSGGGAVPGTTSLPPPNHAIDFGYYFVDSKYGQFSADVSTYTNLAYIGPNNVLPDGSPQSDIKVALGLAIGRMVAAGLSIVLDLERGSLITVGGALEAASPYWSHVKYVVVNGDWTDTQAALNAEIVADRQRIANLGLGTRPMGVVFDGMQILGDWPQAQELDFVVIEAYPRDFAHHGTSQQNIAAITADVNAMKGVIPASKKLGVVMAAYTQNGRFAPVSPDLVDLQSATYLLVNTDTRVDFLLGFSYARPSGTQENTALKPAHQAIWAALHAGQSVQCQGQVIGDCVRCFSGGVYPPIVFPAIDQYIATAPAGVIDPADHEHVLNASAYIDGVAALINVQQPALVAQQEPGQDGKQMEIKRRGDSISSEHYKMWSGGGAQTYVRRFYAATCYPARF